MVENIFIGIFAVIIFGRTVGSGRVATIIE